MLRPLHSTDRTRGVVSADTQVALDALVLAWLAFVPRDVFDVSRDCAVVVCCSTSAIHLLTLALGVEGVFARVRALSRPVDDAGWKRRST
jgi:hypothetical protein